MSKIGMCLHCKESVGLDVEGILASRHRAVECPVKREQVPLFEMEYLPLEFMGVGPAYQDYDELQKFVLENL